MQGENTLLELQRRGLLDVILPIEDVTGEERSNGIVFPRRFASIEVERGRMVFTVERDFFATAKAAGAD